MKSAFHERNELSNMTKRTSNTDGTTCTKEWPIIKPHAIKFYDDAFDFFIIIFVQRSQKNPCDDYACLGKCTSKQG
jgi:hypothetical protein